MAEKNAYATNKGGKIDAPHKPKDEPKAKHIEKGGKDLRTGR